MAHYEGIRHRAAHLWLVRNKDEKIQVLLQKRSPNKEHFLIVMIFPVLAMFPQEKILKQLLFVN